MSFAPPSSPPPPPVPPGWKAQWNDKHKSWFFVNLRTGVSQWEDPGNLQADAPPSYEQSGPRKSPIPEKKSGFPSNNPYGDSSSTSRAPDTSEDARLAAKLQAEEDARARGASSGVGRTRDASSTYFNNQGSQAESEQPIYGQSQVLSRGQQGGGQQRGLLGKIFGGNRNDYQNDYNNSGNYGPPGGGYPPQQGYGGPPPPVGYGGYPPPGNYGGYPPPGGYGGYPPPGGYGYGPPPPQQYYQEPQRQHSSMGGLGGAALGVGGGLLAGALITDAIDDHDQSEYNQGYDQGYDQGQDNSYDDGGF